LGTITAGNSKQYTVTVKVDSDFVGTLTNNVSVTSATPDTNAGNNSASASTQVTSQADLSVTKLESADPVVAGTNLTYTLVVANAGPSDAQNVSVTDNIPAGTTLISATGCDNDPGGVPSCNLGTIAAGASKQYTIKVLVDPGTTGSISNTASASSSTTDPISGNNSATQTTAVTAQADLSVTKTESADPV